MRKGWDASAEKKLICSNCNESLEHTACLGCQKKIEENDNIKCFGPEGERWHKCIECDEFEYAVYQYKCPKCEGKHLTIYGKDVFCPFCDFKTTKDELKEKFKKDKELIES